MKNAPKTSLHVTLADSDQTIYSEALGFRDGVGVNRDSD